MRVTAHLACLIAMLLAPALLAQGGFDDGPPPDEGPPPSEAQDGPHDDGPPPDQANGGSEASYSDAEIKAFRDEVEDAVRDRFPDLFPPKVLARNRLQLGVSGSADFEFHHVQKNSRRGSYTPATREPNGFMLDETLISFDARYNELNGRSVGEFNLALELFEDGIELDSAYFTFDGIISRIRIPGRTDVISNVVNDNIRLGLSPVFWRNDFSAPNTYSLLETALARDERLMLQYTAAIGDHSYVVLGMSQGSVNALGGSLSDANRTDDAFAILQDDRSAYFENAGDERFVTSRPEGMIGAGTSYSWREGATPVRGARPFHPSSLAQQVDLVHLQVWGTHDRLSAEERNLVSLALDEGPSSRRSKWRAGVNASVAWQVDQAAGHHFRFRSEYAHAQDGELGRDFVSVEASFAWLLPDTTPVLYGIEPYARWSALYTNQEGPNLRAVATLDEYRGAAIAGDRSQLTLGCAFKLAPLVLLRLEYVANRENFNTPPGVSSGVSNDLIVLGLQARW